MPTLRRPRRVLWLLPALWLVACCVIALHLVQGDQGYEYAGHRVVPVDGRPHVVSVSEGEPTMVWHDEIDSAPPCTVDDGLGRLELTDAADGYRMQGGDDAMIGASTFTPATSSVVVQCAGQGSEVLLATAPSGPFRTAGTRAVRAVGAGGLVLLGVLSTALALGFGLQQRRTKQVPRASYRP